jgi:hypothetical protein
MEKSGSGINNTDPHSETLETVDYCTYRIVGIFIPEDRRLSSEQVCQIVPVQERRNNEVSSSDLRMRHPYSISQGGYVLVRKPFSFFSKR